MVSLQWDCTLFHLNFHLLSQIYQQTPGHETKVQKIGMIRSIPLNYIGIWYKTKADFVVNVVSDHDSVLLPRTMRQISSAGNRTHAFINLNIVFPIGMKLLAKNFFVRVRFSKINVSDSWCAICQKIVTLPKICKVSWTLSFFQCKSWPVLYTVCPRQVWWTDPKALETGMTRV